RFSRDWSSDVCSSDLRQRQFYGKDMAVLVETFKFKGLAGDMRFSSRCHTMQTFAVSFAVFHGDDNIEELSTGFFFSVAKDALGEIGRASCRERGEVWL